jgi:hypothetical protein
MRNIQPPVDTEKLFIGDIRETPRGVWMRAGTVEEAINIIKENYDKLYLISFGRDVGDYNPPDYIKILDWIEEFYGSDFKIFIEIHSQNPIGIANMRRIIERNGWKELR